MNIGEILPLLPTVHFYKVFSSSRTMEGIPLFVHLSIPPHTIPVSALTHDRLHHRNPSSLRQIEISSLLISLPCQPRARIAVPSIASASAAAAEPNRRCWRWLSRVLSNLKNLHRCAALLALNRTLSSFAHLIFIPLERDEGDCINRCASPESSSEHRTVFREAD